MRSALEDQREWLLVRIVEKPDITLRALVAELSARGVDVSLYAVWNLLARAGIKFKKSLRACEQDRPDVARRRRRWRRLQRDLDPARLVFIDETWARPT